MDNLFKKMKTKLDLYQFAEIQNLDSTEFKTSPYDARYILPTNELKDYVKSIIPLPESEPKEIIFQILKNSPNTVYKTHIDAIRFCAINTLISLPDDDHIFEMIDVDGNIVQPNYNGNHLVPFLINVEQKHGVQNKSSSNTRYILSIGFFIKKYDYNFLYNWFKTCNMI